MDIGRRGTLRAMRWLVLLLIFQTGYIDAIAAQEIDEAAAPELNLHEFVPLEVGNRWIYTHSYFNEMFYEWDDLEEEEIAYWKTFFKQFEIPGYPFGESIPPRDLTRPDNPTLVVEITHTEWIDGFEYFVFSEAPYNWPPPPVFFWAGEKVRLSEDGILLFRKYGTDVPLYDFSPQREGIDSAFLLVHKYGTDVPLYDFGPQREDIDSAFEYIPIDIRRWMRDRLTYPDPLDKVINPAYRNQILEIDFSFIAPFYSVGEWNTQFVKGYGIGISRREILGTGNSLRFWNGLSPISAILSGKEVSFQEATSRFVVEPELPPIWGQLGKISNQSGFDFSKGTEAYGPEDDLYFGQDIYHGFGDGPPSLSSRIGMAALGQVEFGSFVSEGLPDLRPDPPHDVLINGMFLWSEICQEGYTYAFWTQEGGIALMHILKISRFSKSGTVRHLLFDWVYYPASDRSPDTTSVQPTSWGQLKDSLLRTK